MNFRLWLAPSAMAIFLIVVAQYKFLAFHTLAELFAIVISFIMFAFAWSTRDFARNNFMLFLACGYFWIGSLDLMHTLVYKGMDVFVEGSGNLSVQFWIGTRYLEALLLLVAPFATARKQNGHLLVTFFGVVAATLIALIMSGHFPTGFIEGKGLTAFKIYSEYLIIAILLLALFTIFKKGRDISREERNLISISIILTMCAELAFTFYINVYGLSNLVGHIFKLFSFWFIFQAVVMSNLKKPYAILQESEQLSQNLFDNSEVSIWNEDLTEVVEALDKLQQAGVSNLAQYLQNNEQAAWEMARSVRVIQVNKATLKLFNAKDEREFLYNIDKTFGIGAINVFIEELCAIWNKEKVFRSEAAFRNLDGKDIHAIISFQIPETKPGFRSIPVSIIDMTERQETEKSLRRIQKMDAVGQMAGGIAHDFNNILGIIIGNLSFLKRELKENEKSLKRVETVDKAAQRATDLTQQLLGFSRQQPKQVQSININHIIQGMNSLIVRSVTPEIEVEYNYSDDLWQTKIDSADFEDALLNLVLNARDTMPNRGKLTIDTSNKVLDEAYAKRNSSVLPGEYIEFSINDTGEGIRKVDIDRIFEPFFTTKPRGKGTGLGLSMVIGFIQRSQGHIKVYSELGIGTTIRCYLPRSISSTEAFPDSNNDEVELPQGRETVLIVDDELDLLELAEQYLEDLGYTVMTATDGREAMQVLAGSPSIDLLFSDVVMPGGMNGYELAEQASALNPQLKVLLTSGYTSKTLYRNGQAHFKTNLLNKPYNQREIATSIRRVLDE